MFLFIASGVLAVTAVIHSLLGEKLIFAQLPQLAPTMNRRQRGILRASWHVVSVCGLAFGLQLLLLAVDPGASQAWVAGSVVAALIVSALLVCVCTRGRHPGWVALALAGLLALWG